MSHVLVVVIARDYLYVFLFLSQTSILGVGLDLPFGGITVSREWLNIFTKSLGSEVVSLFIRKVKFGTAFVVHVGVGTADVYAGTSDNVESSNPNVRTSDSD